MAGLRLGYLLADPAVVNGIRLVRLPYHLSALTQAVGLRALQHKGALMSHIVATERERERVAAALDRLPGVRVLPSDANFLCFETPLDPRRLWQGLLDRGSWSATCPGTRPWGGTSGSRSARRPRTTPSWPPSPRS